MNRYGIPVCFVTFSLLLFCNVSAAYGRGRADTEEVMEQQRPWIVVFEQFDERIEETLEPMPEPEAAVEIELPEIVVVREPVEIIAEADEPTPAPVVETHPDMDAIHERLEELDRRVAELDRRQQAYGMAEETHPDIDAIQEQLEELDRRVSELDRRQQAYGVAEETHPDIDAIQERLEELDRRVAEIDRRQQAYDAVEYIAHVDEPLEESDFLLVEADEPQDAYDPVYVADLIDTDIYIEEVLDEPVLLAAEADEYPQALEPEETVWEPYPVLAGIVRPAVANPRIIGRMPAPNERGTFRVQAASRENLSDAQFYHDLVRPVDSRVGIERHGEWYRVVIPSLTASEVPRIVQGLGGAGFGAMEYDPIWIRNESDEVRRPAVIRPRNYVPTRQGIYTIQVGAYESVTKAYGILSQLRSEGIANSRMEQLERSHGRFHHVFITSVRGMEVEGLLQRLGNVGVEEVWVQSEP